MHSKGTVVLPAILVVALLGLTCSSGTQSTVAPTPTRASTAPFEPSIAGDYDLTFTASPSCSLPVEVRERHYRARIAEPSRGVVTVDLSGASFLSQLPAGFEGTRDEAEVHFALSGRTRWVAESIGGTRELFYSGTASATLADRNITGRFNGQIWLSVAGNLFDGIADCTAADHKIDFVRQ